MVGLVELRSQPTIRGMALLAVLREIKAGMAGTGSLLEIAQVTGGTLGRKPLKLTHCGALVALLALHGRVRSEQWKTVFMIFYLLRRNLPAEDGVALRAVRAHFATMNIGVTILAVLADVGEHRLAMTLYALHLFVHTT